MADNDGTEPLDGHPVILTLAFSTEEWAIISACILSVKVQANMKVARTGQTIPEEIQRMIDIGDSFHRIVRDEMAKIHE